MIATGSLRFVVSDALDVVDASWASLAQRSAAPLFLRREYLRYANVDHGEVFSLRALAGDALQLGLTGWVATGAGHPYLEPARLLGATPLVAAKRVFVVSCPGAFEGATLIAPELGAGAIARLVAETRARLERLAKERRCEAVVALYFDDAAARRWSGGATPALLNLSAAIDVRGGVDGWLGRLPSHRRQRVRAELRKREQAGLSCGRARDDATLREAAPLYVASEARFDNAMRDADVVAMVARQRDALGDDFLMFTLRDAEGRLRACATAFLEPDVVRVRFAAVARGEGAGGDALEYFHTVYYEPIRFAAETGRTSVELGMESLEAKLYRGARLTPRWAVPLTRIDGWEQAAVRHNAATLQSFEPLAHRFPAAFAEVFADTPEPRQDALLQGVSGPP